jgi:DNA-binding transcriptional LysR family regulator
VSTDMRTIQVTEEEYQLLMRLRQRLERRQTVAERLSELPGGKRSADFTMGAVAGMAAYWLYKELFEEEAPEKAGPEPKKRRSEAKGGDAR